MFGDGGGESGGVGDGDGVGLAGCECGEVVEGVCAVGECGGGADGVAEHVDHGGSAGTGQGQGHPCDTGLAGVLDSVAVGVQPHEITDRHRWGDRCRIREAQPTDVGRQAVVRLMRRRVGGLGARFGAGTGTLAIEVPRDGVRFDTGRATPVEHGPITGVVRADGDVGIPRLVVGRCVARAVLGYVEFDDG